MSNTQQPEQTSYSDVKATLNAKKAECQTILLKSFLREISNTHKNGVRTAHIKMSRSAHSQDTFSSSMASSSCDRVTTERDIRKVIRSIRRRGYDATGYVRGDGMDVMVDLTAEAQTGPSAGGAYVFGLFLGGSLGVLLGGLAFARP